MQNDVSLIAVLAFSTLLPFLIACGTCYIKFSIVFVIVRNALGLQQVPSNMTLNAIALILSVYVMQPIVQEIYVYYNEEKVSFNDAQALSSFLEKGLGSYRGYLRKYSDPDLVSFFEKAQSQRPGDYPNQATGDGKPSIFALLPAYALSEIKNAFVIGFYIYLPFIVIDLVVSSVLLALGMMMMSPLTISVPIKLVLFVAVDGWTVLSKGLIEQYLDLSQ